MAHFDHSVELAEAPAWKFVNIPKTVGLQVCGNCVPRHYECGLVLLIMGTLQCSAVQLPCAHH